MLFPFLFSCWLLLCFRLCALFRFYLIFGFSLFFHLLLSPLLLFFLFVRLFVGSFTFFLFVGPIFFPSFRGRRSTDSVRHSLPFCPGILLAEFFDGLWWSLTVFDGLSMVEGSFSSSPVDSSRFWRARSTIRRTTLRDAPPSESSGIDRLDSFSLEIRTRSIIHLTWLGLAWLDLTWLDFVN